MHINLSQSIAERSSPPRSTNYPGTGGPFPSIHFLRFLSVGSKVAGQALHRIISLRQRNKQHRTFHRTLSYFEFVDCPMVSIHISVPYAHWLSNYLESLSPILTYLCFVSLSSLIAFKGRLRNICISLILALSLYYIILLCALISLSRF